MDRRIWIGLGAIGVCGVVFLACAFWPRAPQDLSPGPDGTVTISAPLLQVAAAVAGWLTLWVAAGLIVFVLLDRGLDGVEGPGAALVVLVVTLASVPDLVRLFTGQLYRWRLSWGPAGVSYRGYRTSLDMSPAALRGVSLQGSRLIRWDDVPRQMRPRDEGPRGFGVVLDARGAGRGVLVPQVFFRVPAEQIADDIRTVSKR